jgi:hypothetical protein
LIAGGDGGGVGVARWRGRKHVTRFDSEMWNSRILAFDSMTLRVSLQVLRLRLLGILSEDRK